MSKVKQVTVKPKQQWKEDHVSRNRIAEVVEVSKFFNNALLRTIKGAKVGSESWVSLDRFGKRNGYQLHKDVR